MITTVTIKNSDDKDMCGILLCYSIEETLEILRVHPYDNKDDRKKSTAVIITIMIITVSTTGIIMIFIMIVIISYFYYVIIVTMIKITKMVMI